MIVIRILLLLLLCLLVSGGVQATHNLAGQVTYTKVGLNTYRITLTTYTDPRMPADQNDCTVDMEIYSVQSDGGKEIKSKIVTLYHLPRKNGSRINCNNQGGPGRVGEGVRLRDNVKKNIYDTLWRFNGPGIFEIRFWRMNRIGDVKNMNNSVGTTFYVETRLNNLPFIGNNNSPQLLNDPIDDACNNKPWTHNPGAYDPDGDSLAFELIDCQQYNPDQMSKPIRTDGFRNPAGPSDFSIDPYTGIVTWNGPKAVGVYNAAILIKEYRNGKLIGYVIRDMAIFVKDCPNDPPKINTQDVYCLSVGQKATIPIEVLDPNIQDSVYFYLYNNPEKTFGVPFTFPRNPAVIKRGGNPLDLKKLPIGAARPPKIDLELEWTPLCEHLRRSTYQIDYYAHDNFRYNPHIPRLGTYNASRIQLKAEAVQNVRAKPIPNGILVEWDAHSCDNVYAYEIYRTSNEIKFEEDTCCSYRTGVPSETGYKRIAYLVGRNTLSFKDDNNGRGLDYKAKYCYRVHAYFLGGMRSCVSDSVCVKLNQDMPVIVNNTVDKTDAASGAITVRWVKPNLSAFTPGSYTEPLSYHVERLTGLVGERYARLTTVPKAFEDTVWTDQNLNTQNQAYRYRIMLVDANNKQFPGSDGASSVFLNAIVFNRDVRLVWKKATPWTDSAYTIFRKNPGSDTYDSIAFVKPSIAGGGESDSVFQHSYVDKNLQKGQTYCYYIKAGGTYFTPERKELRNLINLSNEKCVLIEDKIPPCFGGKDSVKVNNDCDNFRLTFTWLPLDSLCADDVEKITLYYSPTPDGRFQPILSTNNPDELAMVLDNSAQQSNVGCYYLQAVDFDGNTSKISEIFCLDNCPDFILPNVFTPNGDGINDKFVPIAYRSIKDFSFKVFDRWGVELNLSRDPLNLWDGTDQKGNPVPAGYYFYLLEYTANNLRQTRMVRTGGITLIR
jgi:gliding motility-associated-like protein